MKSVTKTIAIPLLCLGALAPAAMAAGLRIVTDIGPVRAIATAVGGERNAVEHLIPQGRSAHDFALKPSQVRKLSQADLVIWIGPGATPGLARLLLQDAFRDTTLTLNAIDATIRLPVRPPGVFAASVDHQAERSQDFDPHTWLDPVNAVLWAQVIAARLAGLDPQNADEYRRNAQTFRREIDAAISTGRQRFAETELLPYVRFHDAFHYFEARFGLQPLGAATGGGSETASLGIITGLRAVLKKSKSACVMVADAPEAGNARNLTDIPGVTIGVAAPMGSGRDAARSYTGYLAGIIEGHLACLIPAR